MGTHPDSTLQITPLTDAEPFDDGGDQPAVGDAERRPARLALYAGIALFAIGLLVLYLGYNGAATNPQVAAQIPYVVSGGFAGATLVVLGGIFVLVHVLLGVQANLRADVAGLTAAVQDVADGMAKLRVQTSAGASSNGAVVALREGSSFHRPQCRLVANRDELQHLLPADARDRGLTACRICKP